MRYRNIQGLRAIAALLVVASHCFQNIEPMRTHWAKPYTYLGGVGVDIFFVISGFIIYHVMQRTIASMDVMDRGRAVYAFAIKRFIRIYPVYWIAFGTSCLVMAWMPLTAPPNEPLFKWLALVDNVPNFRLPVAWTLTYEVYFYAVVALSLLLFARRAMVGLAIWFAIVGVSTLFSLWFPLEKPLDSVLSPIVLEFPLGIAVAMVVDRGLNRFHGAILAGALICMAVGALRLSPALFAQDLTHWGWHVAVSRSFARRVVCLGIPAAIVIYGMVVLEIRQRWIMPRVLQYLGDASFSIYLWHVVVFNAVAEEFARRGWVGVVSSTGLTVLMVAIALAVGLLSYHFLEKPSLRILGKTLVSRNNDRKTACPSAF